MTARAEQGTLEISRVPVDLRAQAAQVIESLDRPRLGLDVLTCRDEVHAVGDPGRVRQILRNLLSNAVHHGGPRIALRLDHDRHWARAVVADDGRPIPEDLWEGVFDPYRRAHESPGQPASLGLGLYVARYLADLVGGRLVYHYEHGESQFRLTLPRAA